jgi:hypothetical protein
LVVKEKEVTGFENQIPGGEKPRKESVGEKAHKLAGMLAPFFRWFGIRFNEEALASVLASLVVYAKSKMKAPGK